MRDGVEVTLLAQEGETYVLAHSRDRVGKERAIRRRRLKLRVRRLQELADPARRARTRDDLLRAVGAAEQEAGRAADLASEPGADRSPCVRDYCLHLSLRARLRSLAPGLAPRAVLEKLSGLQKVDVRIPTTDGRELVLSRHTEPTAEQRLLIDQLRMELPEQPCPRMTSTGDVAP